MKITNKIRISLLFLGIICTLNLTAFALQGINSHKNFHLKHELTLLQESQLNTYLEKQLVLYYIQLYTKDKELPRLLKRSKPLLKHVISELKKRNLPKELALLPIVESSYQPLAVSNKGATGIWQISYVAGKRYGLIENNSNKHIDYRSDIAASTKAALSYLEFLYKRFNNDWLLALAAYNAGEGRISRAIKKNIFIGKNTNYWSLTLPKETINYVPKLLALSIIFNNPQEYGFDSLDLF